MIEFGPLSESGVEPPGGSVLQLQPLAVVSSPTAGTVSVLQLENITTVSLLSSVLQLGSIEIFGRDTAGNYGVAQLDQLQVVSSPELPDPVIGIGYLQLGELTIDALVTAVTYNGANNLQMRGIEVVSGAGTGGYAVLELERISLFGEAPITYTDFFAMEMEPYAFMEAGTYYNAIISSVQFDEALVAERVLVLADALRFVDIVGAPVVYNITLNASFSAHDSLAAVFDVALADTALLNDLSTGGWLMYSALADALVCTGVASSQMNALSLVASVLVSRDLVALVHEASIDDPLLLTEAAASTYNQIVQILESVGFADLGTSGLFITGLLDESVEFEETLTATSVFNLLLTEQVVLTSRLRIFGEDYVGYVMNTRTRGVTQYQGYNFNSFAELDGKYYGANDEGLYLLEGDTDDDAPISAYIRTGLTDFGTQFKKQVHDAYIGYTTDGRLLLKVITTDAGERKENWYALNPKDNEATSDNRFRISKGIKSVHWQFEVANIDGADFDISNMTVWPFVLHRRK